MRTLKKIPIMMVACLLGVAIPMKGGTGRDAPPVTHQVINDTTVISQTEPRLLSPGRTFFVPHWYVKAQGGAAYDVGEARFHELLSPAFQLSMGYQPAELIGVRGSLGGLWARNRYAYPEAKYQWNFLQAAVDAELNLTSLLLGSRPNRLTHAYAFVGAGLNWSFGNDEAEEADRRYGVDFQKLWTGSRLNPVIRAGIGLDYAITDNIAIGGELSANMLPDHFNSKRGRGNNHDWHFNALVGVKFTLGKKYGRTEPVYEKVEQPHTRAVEFVDVPIDKISFNVNIYLSSTRASSAAIRFPS